MYGSNAYCVTCWSIRASKSPSDTPPPPPLPHWPGVQTKTLKTFFLIHSLAKVNYLPLNNSIFKDLTLVFCWRDFRKFRFHFKFPIPAKQGRQSNVRGLLGRWGGGNAVSVTSLIIVYISYLWVAPLSSFLSCRWFPKRKKTKKKHQVVESSHNKTEKIPGACLHRAWSRVTAITITESIGLLEQFLLWTIDWCSWLQLYQRRPQTRKVEQLTNKKCVLV